MSLLSSTPHKRISYSDLDSIGVEDASQLAKISPFSLPSSKPYNTYRDWLYGTFAGRNAKAWRDTGKLAPVLTPEQIEKYYMTPKMKPYWDNATPEEKQKMAEQINQLVKNTPKSSVNTTIG